MSNQKPKTETMALAVKQMEKGIAPLVQNAQSLVIRIVEDENSALAILGRIKEMQKQIEDKRTSITKPLNTALKEANKLFKALSEPLDWADSIIRDKIINFHRKREEQAEKQKQRLLEKAEETKDDEKANELIEKAETLTPNVGETTVAKRWTYKVVDLFKVPHKYLVIDSAKVRDAIRDGVREIPGLEIYQEESVRVL